MEKKYWGEKKSPAPKSAQPNGGKPEKHISVQCQVDLFKQ